MLSSIFEQATKSVTKTVLYAGLIPVAAAALINAALAAMLLGGGAFTILDSWLNQSATAIAGWVTAGALMLIISAMAVAALAPVFRAMLEGRSRLPMLSALVAAATQRTAAEAKTRRTREERTKQLLARSVMFRAAQESRLKTARRNAPRKPAPPAPALDGLMKDVEAALSDQNKEGGAAAAIDVLARHFVAHGAAGSQLAYGAVLAHLDDLVNSVRTELGEALRLRADAPSTARPATRYGRELKFIETYVASVYNIESIVFWTRLNHVIPTLFATRLEDAKHSLDLLTSVTVLLWTSALIWFLAIPLAFPGWPVLIAVTAGVWALGYIAYYSATAAALSFAELVCAAFDLFRRDLLVALGVEAPLTLREERDLWLTLGRLMLYTQVPDDLTLMPARAASVSDLDAAAAAPAADTAAATPHAPGTIVVPTAGKPSGS